MQKFFQSSLRFNYLFVVTLMNFFFIAFCLKEVPSPIFILGNLKIIFFNIILFSFSIVFGNINKYQFIKFFKFKKLTLFDKFSIIIIPTLLSIIFWSLFPTIIDRSISIKILGNLEKENSFISLGEINQNLLDTYINVDYQTRKRLSEQIYLGNIIEKNKKYKLTSKGKFFTRFHRFLVRYFNLEDI